MGKEQREAFARGEYVRIAELMDALMEIIVDETPDDATDTDDHPLEEARTHLLEASDIIEAWVKGSP